MNEVLYEARGPVALITINREARRNALDLAACSGLMECWRRLEADTALRVGLSRVLATRRSAQASTSPRGFPRSFAVNNAARLDDAQEPRNELLQF
jgi:hypothetical protein